MSTEQDVPVTFVIRQCAFCRRVRDDGEAFGKSEWQEITTYMNRYRLDPADVLLSDTYCDECTKFYRQLVTYGNPTSVS